MKLMLFPCVMFFLKYSKIKKILYLNYFFYKFAVGHWGVDCKINPYILLENTIELLHLFGNFENVHMLNLTTYCEEKDVHGLHYMHLALKKHSRGSRVTQSWRHMFSHLLHWLQYTQYENGSYLLSEFSDQTWSFITERIDQFNWFIYKG
jgi:hypothetical protein